VEEARQAARDYLVAEARWLEETARCLRAGARWTDRDERQLRERADHLADRRRAWKELLEE
jgi:hypothetical protein